MVSFYLVLDIIIAIGLLLLAFTAVVKDGYKYPVNRLFVAFSVLTSLWIVANHVSNNIQIPKLIAQYADFIVFGASFGVAILLCQFIIKISSAYRLDRLLRHLNIPLWILCLLSATPLITAGVEVQGNVYAVIFGPLIWLYGAALLFLVVAMGYSIVYGFRHVHSGRRRQLVSVSIGIAVAVPLILVLSFIVPTVTGIFSVTEFGITPMIILVFCLYYSVLRYQLFDIKVAAVRTVTYVLSLLSLSAIYYVAAYVASLLIFSGSVASSIASPFNILLALILAFVFQPIRRFFDRFTNAIFFRDRYNTGDFFARLTKKISSITDLETLLNYASTEVSRTMNAEFGEFLIYRQEGSIDYFSESKRRKMPLKDLQVLDMYVQRNVNTVLLTDRLLEHGGIELRRLLLSHQVALVLPIAQNMEIIGYLFLGEHQSAQFTARDTKALSTIADELSIAIQNALSLQAVKDLNANLQQKVDEATRELRATNAQLQRLDEAKDEFISMASHQLRTPLTSVKGYISMVMEGDAGKITESQKQLLSEAFVSSERMVHLINDFLNVSRLQTGKFVIDKSSVDLVGLIKEEVQSLKATAESRDLSFKLELPKQLRPLQLDEGKIRQVIMNFADNALYYSKEASQIKIKLAVTDQDILFTVTDHGIGVPPEEQQHLFTKFFRASNAKLQRPDGTGVGLFLAKKVVVAHGGSLIFESKENKGSTFGFRLPLSKL